MKILRTIFGNKLEGKKSKLMDIYTHYRNEEKEFNEWWVSEIERIRKEER
jgi:hypothetical protein